MTTIITIIAVTLGVGIIGFFLRINYKTNQLRRNAQTSTRCSIFNKTGDRIPARVISTSGDSITLITLDGIKTRSRKELYL